MQINMVSKARIGRVNALLGLHERSDRKAKRPASDIFQDIDTLEIHPIFATTQSRFARQAIAA